MKNDKPKFFNRHGKVMTDQPLVPGTPVKDVQGKAIPKRKVNKQILLIMLAVIVFIGAGYLALNKLAVSSYHSSASDMVSKVKELGDSSVLQLQTGSKPVSVNDLKDISSQLKDIENKACDVAWAPIFSTYGSAFDARNNCQSKAFDIFKLEIEVKTLATTYQYVADTQNALAVVNVKSDEAFANVAEQTAKWQKLQQSITSIVPPDSFKSVHKKLTNAVASIANNWQALQVASDNQSGEDFRVAEAQLAVNYEALRQLSANVTDLLIKQQNGFVRPAYKAAIQN